MKKMLAIFAALLFTSSVLGEETKAYTQYDTFRFTINNKDAKILTDNMRNHIKKYHLQGMLKTKIYNITYGANTNEFIWVMGPVSYAEFDSRADDKKHDDDWADNINPYIISYNQSEVWRSMDGLLINNIDEKASDSKRYITRYLTVNSDQDEKVVNYLLNQIKDTLNKIGKVKYWAVMGNQFIQGNLNGRHLMAISSMENWAELDDDWEFEKHFEALHGKGSYTAFRDNYGRVFKNQWQEVIEVNKEMSGM
ncbi:hypothetical protein [Colwellia hornerae]|uniref:Uncharacterized protein n=1 Tax=Colwellia hornerae TaxID=89402 RepID=A0A5C6QTW5_9GAMM|nr:hypothetical protein [Colwellia hornerae]TWX56956.1 hypothetical protein ESZ28_04170 [Colwellia hornerae]TWX62319.1 hypothetical protein ESZ26_02720 [Colwellia hornerae]TWX72349.1 hypothetical protein ESZ27_00645 [Colwellia hornerae]